MPFRATRPGRTAVVTAGDLDASLRDRSATRGATGGHSTRSRAIMCAEYFGPPSSLPSRRHQSAHLYSITSSARASKDGGTVMPSALAVLRLIASSKLTGFCTGSSCTLAPLRMRSTYDAARRYMS